ncbi:serine hydrolase domain-containing protein [Micromonospora sp. NPDC048839]|uniref:serine hydrolase domain-containing protein n=1 Tax=Micromonospora sp. NPDC048839 TaxID=3155641 RepID=UPI0033D2E577
MHTTRRMRTLVAGVTAGALALAPLSAASAALVTRESPAGAPVGAPAAELTGIGQLVDQVVSTQLARDRIPGAAVVVVAGGKQVFAKGYGVSNVPARTPVDAASTAFFTGSVAKIFTATAAAQLIRQGKLDPSADVNTYLKAFKIRDTYPGHPVTVADLLTHTAGFDDDPRGVAVADPAAAPALGEYLAAHQPDRVRPPGTLARYDNYGVALAGYLVQVVSGQPFAQYAQDHVFGPLGMSGTTFVQPHPAAIQARVAVGYRPVGRGQVREEGQYGAWSPTGAGTVATATDLGTFMIAQMADDPRLGAGVAQSLREQHFTMDPRLPGMGWMLQHAPRNGQPMLFKNGDVPGFHANLAMLPDQKIGIYVVYNGDGTNGVASWNGRDLIHQIVDRYVPDTSPAPKAVSGIDTSGLAGNYRVNRISHTQVTKVVALLSTATVAVAPGGSLTTSGLSLNPNAGDQHWYPIGTGLFQEQAGQAQLAFDGKGNLFTSDDPTVAFTKLAWYSSPTLHQIMLGAGVVVLLVAFLWFPILALVRQRKGKPAHSRWARAARVAAWLTGGLTTLFIGWLAVLASDMNALTESVVLGSVVLTVLLSLNGIAVATTAVMIAGTGAAWARRWWTVTGRMAYTITTIAAISYLMVAFTYNLIGTPMG